MTDQQTERFVAALEKLADGVRALSKAQEQTPCDTAVAFGKKAEQEPYLEKPTKAPKASKQEAKEPVTIEEPAKGKSSKVDMISLTTLARKLVRSEKKAQVLELLEERGIAKISATPKEDWDEVFEALQEIDDL